MTPQEKMHRLDALFSHVWMVRTFLKHSDEAQEDDELCEVHRLLYDVMHALGPAFAEQNAVAYLKQATKKSRKLRQALELFEEIQSEISEHMNFKMSARSLRVACDEILALLGD